MTNKLNEHREQDVDMFVPTSATFPGIPDWLNLNDALNKTDDLTITYFKFINADHNSELAYEIATDFETGKLPGGINAEVAHKWYAHAANIGSAYAAIRLFHIDGNPKHLKCALINVSSALDSMFSAEKVNSHLNVALFAATKLIELNSSDESDTHHIETILKNRRVSKLASSEIVKQLNRLQVTSSGVKSDTLSHTVIKHDITDDGDFKVGIYKSLMTKLPLAELNTSPELILETLNTEFPWFHHANKQVYKQLQARLHSGQPAFKLRPLLLAGPAGVGKTTWANRLAELVDVPSSVVMAAGSTDSMHLKGLARGWGSARPGALAQLIAVEKIANPMMVVDEIDKAATDNRNGSIWDVMLQLIEPSTSKCYLDECLQVPCDFSWVSWIATCNTLGRLPKPLLDRFTVVLIEKPSPEHAQTIINGAIRAYAKDLSVDQRMLPALDGDDIEMLTSLSPREINRVVRMMMEDRLTKNKNPAMH
ncbi:AAA family ATPase [Methylotenera sp.]|uniref:AAA family ATPase n=1 Tax=Methylotenera sp. TaxID=2051956 RepID=UPI0027331D9C|nr:AAA family ATPase [Methylotenera sp.]MDP3211733.1 AAA family ATPase [Methylotenera sp.]